MIVAITTLWFWLTASAVALQPYYSAQNPVSTIPKVDGLRFNIDGATKYWAGTNAYWLPFLQNFSDVDHVLDNIAVDNLRILRTWGFNDVNRLPEGRTVWFQSFVRGQDPVINTGPTGLQHLDYVVRASEKRGIKLIIPFVNNWNDYGGMQAYAAYCQPDTVMPSKADWYTNEKCQAQYQKYIKAVVSRYVNSTAIFAWELANEPRCKGCGTEVVTAWAEKTSNFIKSLDPRHLVAVGDEGFGLKEPEELAASERYPYTFVEGTDFGKLLALPSIDLGTFHLYPGSWNTSVEFGSGWVQQHAEACRAVNKPCLFEEYGIHFDEKCSSETLWQKTSLETKGQAGDLFWQYGDTISTGKTADDKNTIYRQSENWKCIVEAHRNNIAKLPAEFGPK